MKALIAGAAMLLGACNMPGGDTNYSTQDAVDGARFRFEIREVMGRLNPVCPYTRDAQQLARYAPLQKRYDDLNAWVTNSPFATDLVIAASDHSYYWQVNTIDCGQPDTPEALKQLDAELTMLDQQISALEKLVGMT